MIRQRVHLRRPGWELLIRGLTIAFGLALAYGGAMVSLLAVKVSPDTVNQISAYRTLYHDAAGLSPANFTTEVSLIAGIAGFLVFLAFAFLTLQALPRPYFSRSEITLPETTGGTTVVRPRAVERVAEYAAGGHPDVVDAAGRLSDDELSLDIGVRCAEELVAILTDVRERVAEQLQRHDLPVLPVNVALTGYDRSARRDSP